MHDLTIAQLVETIRRQCHRNVKPDWAIRPDDVTLLPDDEEVLIPEAAREYFPSTPCKCRVHS